MLMDKSGTTSSLIKLLVSAALLLTVTPKAWQIRWLSVLLTTTNQCRFSAPLIHLYQVQSRTSFRFCLIRTATVRTLMLGLKTVLAKQPASLIIRTRTVTGIRKIRIVSG